MKIIEALKKVKDLRRKADDLRTLVKAHCARSSIETDKYEKQDEKVAGWIQAHSDLLKELLRLQIAIQKTNLETEVTIDLQGTSVVKPVTKSIAEWIHRRRELSHIEFNMWNSLTDRGITEGMGNSPSGDPVEIKIVRFFDPSERDEMKDALLSEPSTIDGRLEIVNAITDLIE